MSEKKCFKNNQMNNLISELKDNFINYKSNEPSLIQPTNYPIHISTTRVQLINWLIFICDNLHFNNQTLFRSVIIFDKFLSKNPKIEYNNQFALNLVAIACLSLATKLEEVNCNFINFLTNNVLNTPEYQIYTQTDLTKMEFFILKTLKFKTLYSTALDFNSIYIELFEYILNSKEGKNTNVLKNFIFVSETCLKNFLVNDMFINMSQSDIAFMAFCQTINNFGMNQIIINQIQFIFSYGINSKIDKEDNNLSMNKSNNYLTFSSL